MTKVLRFSTVLVLSSFLMMIHSCTKDEFIPNIQEDHTTTSIRASIPRIVPNGKNGINVFVTVSNQTGEAIKGLTNKNFSFELIDGSGQAQTLSPSGPGKLPSLIISALALDYSGSMYTDTFSVPAMESAAATFINLKNPYDQIELIKFSKDIQVTVPLTDNLALLLAGLDDTTFVGKSSTALYAALQTGLDNITGLAATNPTYLPSIIGFTDGKNNQPPHHPDSLVFNSILNQVPIYAIGYGSSPDTMLLKSISNQTGGQFFWSPYGSDMQTVYQHVNGQLTNTTIIPLPAPQSKGKVTIRCTVRYNAVAGKLKAIAEKDYYY